MYMVPQRTPAPRAAQTPRMGCAAGAWVAEAMASKVAPTHITSVPPKTPAQRRQPAWRNSLKKRNPQRMPSRLLEFQSGKAMLRPMSRMAKIVRVLATAQRQPARMAQMIKCGARRTSARTEEVPRIRAGKLQRARKTPMTMISEITMGDTPMETSLVGASAAPSQAPAVNPERMPSVCSFRERERSLAGTATPVVGTLAIFLAASGVTSVNRLQEKQSRNQHRDGNPKMNVGQNVAETTSLLLLIVGLRHKSPGTRRVLRDSAISRGGRVEKATCLCRAVGGPRMSGS